MEYKEENKCIVLFLNGSIWFKVSYKLFVFEVFQEIINMEHKK